MMIDRLVGRTPMVRLHRVVPDGGAEVWLKLEGMNPAGSIKDRTALAMVLDAEERGVLSPGDEIVEPTSGNTGIGLAQVAGRTGLQAHALSAVLHEHREEAHVGRVRRSAPPHGP